MNRQALFFLFSLIFVSIKALENPEAADPAARNADQQKSAEGNENPEARNASPQPNEREIKFNVENIPGLFERNRTA